MNPSEISQNSVLSSEDTNPWIDIFGINEWKMPIQSPAEIIQEGSQERATRGMLEDEFPIERLQRGLAFVGFTISQILVGKRRIAKILKV